MTSRNLLASLVLPLLGLASCSMAVALRVRDPWASLFVNLAAAFLGAIVTVFYVDVIRDRTA
jgi:hypothetical protein